MKSSQPENETRPWGHYDVLLQETFCKVKRIEVAPNSRLSYQTHSKREEVWVIVTGTGIITLNGNTQAYGPGAIVHIPTGTAHRIANPEKCVCVCCLLTIQTYGNRTRIPNEIDTRTKINFLVVW